MDRRSSPHSSDFPAEQVDQPGTSESASNKRSRKSEVWNCFTLQEIEANGSKVTKAVCNYCKNIYAFNSKQGTGTLRRHMSTCVPKHTSTNIPTQSQLNISSTNLSSFSYNQKKMREGLAMYIASAEQPFTFAEDERLQRFVKNYLQPNFNKISRNTSRSDILKIFYEKKTYLINELANHTGAISFTSDMWTSITKYGYICLTAHYIDNTSWMLIKKIIAFRMLEHPHTGSVIYQAITDILTEYNLITKCFSISFDNHSANNSAIELFKRSFRPPYDGQLFHLRCACHIINLIVQDGIKIIGEDESLNFIENIRESILLISSSPSRFQKFRNICKNNNIKPKKLTTDVSTRWNSTYLMLKSCVGFEQSIIEFNAQQGNALLDFDDFIASQLYMQFLDVFYVATNILSGIYYPTTCIALNQLYNMAVAFSSCKTMRIYPLVCSKMEIKFRKYWECIPPIFYLASVMDPRKKLYGTCQLLDGISVSLQINILENYNTIFEKLTILYNNYQTKYGNNIQQINVRQPPPKYLDSAWALLGTGRGKEHVGSSSSNVRSELSIYLDTDYLNFLTYEELDNFDILSWWRTHSGNLPVLSIMARDLLTPPVSTVASESCFSAGGRVLSDRRSKLKPDILDALICLKDWDDAEHRCQDDVDSLVDEFAELETGDTTDD